MHLVIVDDNESIVAQYNKDVVKELLSKYYDIYKNIPKAFDQLSEDLLEKARTVR